MKYCSGLQAEFLRQQASGLVAFAVVGVALVQRELRQAVEAHHQFFRAAVLHPVVVDVVRQRLDVAGVVVEILDGAQRGGVAHFLQFGEHDVEGGAAAAGGILRIHRHDQDALAVLFLEFAQHAGDGRVAVAHRVVHDERRLGALAQDSLAAARSVSRYGRATANLPASISWHISRRIFSGAC